MSRWTSLFMARLRDLLEMTETPSGFLALFQDLGWRSLGSAPCRAERPNDYTLMIGQPSAGIHTEPRVTRSGGARRALSPDLRARCRLELSLLRFAEKPLGFYHVEPRTGDGSLPSVVS